MSIINYAHRGASAYYPDNTLRAFYAGLEMGADGIETDIQRTKDGVLVLSHDDSLERAAGLKECISELTYKELLDVDLGIRMGERFKGERIVRLDTFLTHFGRRGLTLALEIKKEGIEADCLRCVNDLRCREDVIFTSFMWESLIALRKLDTDIRVGFLTWEITEKVLDDLTKNHIQQICPIISKATPEGMALAARKRISVRFWGVNDTDLMRRAIELGGDGMTINFPDKLTSALRA